MRSVDPSVTNHTGLMLSQQEVLERRISVKLSGVRTLPDRGACRRVGLHRSTRSKLTTQLRRKCEFTY